MLILPCHTLPTSVPLAKWSQGIICFVSQRILACCISSLFIRSCVDKSLKTQLISIACLLKIKRACRKSDRTTIRLNKSCPLHLPWFPNLFRSKCNAHCVNLWDTGGCALCARGLELYKLLYRIIKQHILLSSSFSQPTVSFGEKLGVERGRRVFQQNWAYGEITIPPTGSVCSKDVPSSCCCMPQAAGSREIPACPV